MPKSRKASRIALEERIDRVEEMLATGISPGRIERVLGDEYGVSL